jgi:hypothetical protein
MHAGKGKSSDFRLFQALAYGWFERVSAATSFSAAFRPLFRRVAPLVHGYTL